MIHGKSILCAAASGYGHMVPTLSLALALRAAGGDVTMLTLADDMDSMCERHELRTHRLSPRPLLQMAEAFRRVLQELDAVVSVCDWSPAMWIALHSRRPACRISILRCEMLLGYQRRNVFLSDKFNLENQIHIDRINTFFAHHGSTEFVTDPRQAYAGEIIVIPSVPHIDPLPRDVTTLYPNATFVYTGPLLPPNVDPPAAELISWVEDRRRERTPVLLVTLGTAWGTGVYTALADCFQRTEFATVMIVPGAGERRRLETRANPRLFVSGFTDVLSVARKVDAVVHHCGHGTLHTALIAGKPSVTLPSGEYDREDNALRIEDLYCVRHLGHDFFRRGMDPHALSAAITAVLESDQIKKGTAAMSCVVNSYAASRGPAEVVRALERYLN